MIRIAIRHLAVHLRASAVSIALGMAACTSFNRPGPGPDGGSVLAFENATEDEVAVYVEHGGARQMLGHVEPGRQSHLRIPDFATLRMLSDVRLVVVPLGSTRDGARGVDIANAICSEFDVGRLLVGTLWSVKGHTLVNTALPRNRKGPEQLF